MTSIHDKAEGSPDVDLARQSAPGAYVLLTEELTEADELTDEGEFPEYGDFLQVAKAKQSGDGIEEGPERYIECPAALARWLVEAGVEVGQPFRVVSNRKVDGEWEYDCEEL